jgi:hypothetical protein
MKKVLIVALAVTLLLTLAAVPVMAEKGGKNCDCVTIQDGTLLASNGDPITTGFDEYGYNYQAHQYIGYYGNYQRPPEPVDWGYRLMMKWNDAWLSNKDCDGDGLLDRHYGFDSYIGSGAWLTNHQSGTYTVWDLTGTYTIVLTCTSACSGDYPHTMIVDIMDLGTGEFSGTGHYDVNIDTTWVVTGTVTDSQMTATIDYDDSSYYVDLDGVIAEDGTMSGTAESASHTFTWETTAGAATPVECKFDYFVKIVAVPADASQDGGIWYAADGTEIGPVIWGDFAVIQEVCTDKGTGDHGVLYKSFASPGFGFYKP